MWGPSFIFAPIIEQGTSERQMYLPEGDLWYSGENLLRDKVNGWVTVVSDLDDGDQALVPMFIRAGTGGLITHRQETLKQQQRQGKVPWTLGLPFEMTKLHLVTSTLMMEKVSMQRLTIILTYSLKLF